MVNLNHQAPELQLLKAEHSKLRRIVTECRSALESKTASVPLAGLLQLLLEKLIEHLSREKDCDYFVGVELAAPRFHRKNNQLFREHYLMILKVVEMQRCVEPGKPPQSWARICEIFSDFACAFDKHETEEAELFELAFGYQLDADA